MDLYELPDGFTFRIRKAPRKGCLIGTLYHLGERVYAFHGPWTWADVEAKAREYLDFVGFDEGQ